MKKERSQGNYQVIFFFYIHGDNIIQRRHGEIVYSDFLVLTKVRVVMTTSSGSFLLLFFREKPSPVDETEACREYR